MKNNIRNDLKEQLYNLLPKSRQEAQPMSYFKQMTGLSRRDITALFLEMREDYPICTDRHSPGGYWLGNEYDLQCTINMLNNTINTMQKSVDYLNKHLEHNLTEKYVSKCVDKAYEKLADMQEQYEIEERQKCK